MQLFIRFFLILLISTNLWAIDKSTNWYTQTLDKKTTINVELFLSSTCSHCHKADEFFKKIEPQTPWLHVQRYTVNQDKNALIRFSELLNDQHMDDFAVPSVFFCNSRWVGFVSEETTGKDLLKGLNYCKQEIEKKGTLTAETVSVLKRWGNANMFDSNMVEHPSTVQYITLMGLMDGINPCAYFCFAGFLGLLFIQNSKKSRIIVGSLYILGIAIVHYILQVYTSNFFELLPWVRVPAALVGLFALYLLREYYNKRVIPYLYFILALLLAILIQAYQQTCLMNWSFIFQQWLLNQTISHNQAALYQWAYQILYLIPITIILIFYVLLSEFEFFTKRKQMLQTTGLLWITSIALILIIYPLALSHFLLSFFTIGLLGLAAWILHKVKNK